MATHVKGLPPGLLYPRGREVVITKCLPVALAASTREELLIHVLHFLPSENLKLPPEVQLCIQTVPPESQQVCG